MQLTNTLIVCATLIAATVAQNPTSTSTSLHFTSIPTALVAGVAQTIGWAGGNGESVNIILQQGPADNLQDVPIAPIASGDESTSTSWTPPKSLPNAGDYALRIEQGEDSVNYSGMLQLFDGCSTCPTNAVAALASTASATASSSSKSAVASPVVASGSKSSSNSTGAAASSSNSTTTGSSMNSTMGTGSMANMTMSGTNSTTNSTMSSAKLHATSSKSSSSSSSTSTSSSSSSSESTSSSTGSSTSPSATKKSSGVTVAASNFALVLCAIVGIVYLG